MYNRLERIKNDLDYGKYQYDSLVALLKYNNKDMVVDNKERALANIDYLENILKDVKVLIENL